MPTINSPSRRIAEPISTDLGARRRFFGVLQKWRNWLCQRIDRSQPGNKDLALRGADDLLALAFLVQFVRDRRVDAIPALDQLARLRECSSLGHLCAELQDATPCAVLKTI